MLRDADGGESHAPAFLQAPAPRAEVSEDAPKPRRKRVAKPASEAEEA